MAGEPVIDGGGKAGGAGAGGEDLGDGVDHFAVARAVIQHHGGAEEAAACLAAASRAFGGGGNRYGAGETDPLAKGEMR